MVNTIRNERNKNKKLVSEISTQFKTISLNSEKSWYCVIYLPLILIDVYFIHTIDVYKLNTNRENTTFVQVFKSVVK